MQLKTEQIRSFQETVRGYYRDNRRDMPWRADPTPYKVLVSEIMLQQTQVSRVMPKFEAFVYTCADFASLAEKSLRDVLILWSGLGYNRRAKYLHLTAQIVVHQHGGVLPDRYEKLVELPGIGVNTAGAILAYAYEKPSVFIETNIRTVMFHHFYAGVHEPVPDSELLTLVDQTLDRDDPRGWYWAMMDYGTFLKRTAGGRLTSSKHYVKQSPLAGSLREMRGNIIKQLTSESMSLERLRGRVGSDARLERALSALEQEGMITSTGKRICLTGKIETS